MLQLEKGTAHQIAKTAKIKRPTTYDILARLLESGFIAESFEDKKHFFIANPPQSIIRFLEEEKREVNQDLPELLSIYNKQLVKPKIAYYEGVEGLRRLYEDSVLSLKPGEEVLAFVSADMAKYFESDSIDFIRERAAKKIHYRGIFQDSIVLREYLNKNYEQLRLAKVVPYNFFPIKNELNIYANKINMITYNPHPFGFMVESQDIADTQRAIFEMIWMGLK